MRRRMKVITILLTLALIITLLVSCAKINPNVQRAEISKKTPTTAEPKPKSKPEDRVIVVIDEWAPYTSEKMEGYGLTSRIVTEAMKAGGVDFEFQFKPWARAMEAVKYGDAWGTFPWFYTEERGKDYLRSDPLMLDKSMLFYYKDNPVMKKPIPEYKEFKDLKDYYKFGGMFGCYYEKIFKEGGFNYDLSSTFEATYLSLKSGRVDLINDAEAVGWYMISKLYPGEEDKFATLPVPLATDHMYMLVTRKNKNAEEILVKFNAGLKKIKENGIYDEIMKSGLTPKQ